MYSIISYKTKLVIVYTIILKKVREKKLNKQKIKQIEKKSRGKKLQWVYKEVYIELFFFQDSQ